MAAPRTQGALLCESGSLSVALQAGGMRWRALGGEASAYGHLSTALCLFVTAILPGAAVLDKRDPETERVRRVCEEHSPEERQFATVIDKLSRLPVAALGNSSVIADLVREVGMVRDTRPLYGFGGNAGSEEEWMHKRSGYGMYQLPKQVGCLLSAMAFLPTRLRTFVEIGSWYGWTGLFFSAYARRLFESRLPSGKPRHIVSNKEFRSASFDIVDMRTKCVKALMAYYSHDFHVPKSQWIHRPIEGTSKQRRVKFEFVNARAEAEAWYRARLAQSFNSFTVGHTQQWTIRDSTEKLDLCFIDAEHSYRHVVADTRFFIPQCRFLLFHDMVDSEAPGVRRVWQQLRQGLLQERGKRNDLLQQDQRTSLSNAPASTGDSDETSWDVEEGYFVKECTQQAGTRRQNFGLGLISAQRLNSSWLF